MINYFIFSLVFHVIVFVFINFINFENKIISNNLVNVDLVYIESNTNTNKNDYDIEANNIKLEEAKNIKMTNNNLIINKASKSSNKKILDSFKIKKSDINNNYKELIKLKSESEFNKKNIQSLYGKSDKKVTTELNKSLSSSGKYYNNLYNTNLIKLSNNSNNITKNHNNHFIKTPRIQILAKPNYPILARLRGIEGVVIIQVLLSEKGDINKINITKKSGHSILDKAAIEAVMKSKFIPAEIDNKYVKSTIKLPVRFSLNN